MTTSKVDQLKILNSIKTGVIPGTNANPISYGRNDVTDEFGRCLDLACSGVSQVKVVTGKYGSGKSHMLNRLKEMSLSNDFVVSHLHLKKGFNLNNLGDLYYHIMHNLYISSNIGEKTSFENIFDVWIENLQNSPFKNGKKHEINYVIDQLNKYNVGFARGFLTYIRARISGDKSSANAVLEWITGERNIGHSVKDSVELVGNIENLNSLDFIKAFVKLIDLLGYKGLVILVDEYDVIINENKNIRLSSYQNLRLLVDLFASSEIEKVFMCISATSDLIYDEEKGFKSYEALSQRLGVGGSTRSSYSPRSTVLNLKPLTDTDYLDVTRDVISRYSSVYSLNLKITPESVKNWVFLSCQQENVAIDSITPREFLVKLMEILDSIEENPEGHVFKTELSMMKSGDGVIFKSKLAK